MEQDFSQEITQLINEKYGGQMTEQAQKDIERIKRGEPVDYVIGWTEFLGCKIDLSERPFIPRPETEYWVDELICDIKQLAINNQQLFTLDIFAGSGCIGIAVLKHVPSAKVDFIEKEERFVRQIEKNLEINKIEKNRYRLIQNDVFSFLEKVRSRISPSRHYDYILANPPYIPQKSKHRVEESVLQWEPHEALFGGEDGLVFIRELAEKGTCCLNKGGKMYVEFDAPAKYAIEKFLIEKNIEHSFFKDQFGKWRTFVVKKE